LLAGTCFDPAGYAEYLPSEGAMAITHVIVRPEFGGRGYLALVPADQRRRFGLAAA